MKRRVAIFLHILLGVFLLGVTAHSQSTINPAPASLRPSQLKLLTNPTLARRLGLTDDQIAKINRTFENHSQNLLAGAARLEKEEAQLEMLLAAEPLDRNAVLIQTDRVIQARGELERENSVMTLEMREHLTRAQWTQLQPGSAAATQQTLTAPVPPRVRVGSTVAAANLINRVQPLYPPAAQQARIQGVVLVEVEISREGIVESVKTISGHPLLSPAALDAVKQWRYKPTLLNGQPVPVITTVQVNVPASAGSRGTPPAP